MGELLKTALRQTSNPKRRRIPIPPPNFCSRKYLFPMNQINILIYLILGKLLESGRKECFMGIFPIKLVGGFLNRKITIKSC